jgi:hypothetical protein
MVAPFQRRSSRVLKNHNNQPAYRLGQASSDHRDRQARQRHSAHFQREQQSETHAGNAVAVACEHQRGGTTAP